MDFYTIIEKSKRYYLEEDTMNGVALSSVQLGVLADRLSSLYQKQQQLELAIRTYITVYYSNGTTEYISLKQRPSLLLSSARVTLKYGSAVTLDGFAATFLDGEEENRVWFGDDGAVENRGESKEKAARLLRMMVEALNEPEQKEDVIYTISQMFYLSEGQKVAGCTSDRIYRSSYRRRSSCLQRIKTVVRKKRPSAEKIF